MQPSREKGAISMFRRIVVATDGSEGARKAVRYVAEKLGEGDVRVALVRVTSPLPRYIFTEFMVPDLDPQGVVEKRTRDEVEEDATPLRVRGIPYEVYVEVGDPASEVVRRARELGADLIVVGRRGLNPLQEIFLGSVSQRILHLSEIPVLVIH